MMRLISRTFPSVKLRNSSPNPNPPKFPKSQELLPQVTLSSSSSRARSSPDSKSRSNPSKAWCVYLILSTNKPIKTYVGVTTDFTRRLKQHNGEIRGGAKASCAGRPWVCACVIHGFSGQSEATAFESKWKSISRKLPRKRKNEDKVKQSDNGSLALLQHRRAALDKVKDTLEECSHLQIDWKLIPR